MAQDRPENFCFGASIGRIFRINPDTWEVDIEAEEGGIVQRALVLGPRLPEVSTRERPQWCVFAHAESTHGRAVCWPIESRLPGERARRGELVYYDETMAFRETITRDGVREIRNTKGPLLQIRILEQDGVIAFDTPSTYIELNESEASIEIFADKNLVVNTGGDVEVTADGNVKVFARGNVTLQNQGGAKVQLVGNQVRLNG